MTTIPSNHRPWAPRLRDPDYCFGSDERRPIAPRLVETLRVSKTDEELREIHQRRLARAFGIPTDRKEHNAQ